MKKIKSLIFCACLVVYVGTIELAEAEIPKTQKPTAISLQQTNPVELGVGDVLPDEAENTPLSSELIAAEQPTDDTLIQIKNDGHMSFIDKTKRYFDAESTENIFGRDFKKTFDTGIVKDVQIIGGHDLALNAFKQSNGISHTVIDNRISLYGVKGSFRDGTMYNFTFVPFLEHVPNYPNGSNRLFEYYVKKNIGKHNAITVGQQRTPNTYEGCRSVFGLPIGRRAQLGNTYSNITAIGAKFSGDYDRVEYQAGIFDAGRFMKDTFYYSPEFATLVSFKPIKNTAKYGKLKVGGSFNHGRRENDYNVCSGHILYDYKKAHVDFEYANANGYSGRSVSRNKSDSYYATFIYRLSPRWEPFLRVDTLNANTKLAGQRNTEYSVGTHYYLKGKKARLTLSFIHANHETKADSNKLFTMLEVLL